MPNTSIKSSVFAPIKTAKLAVEIIEEEKGKIIWKKQFDLSGLSKLNAAKYVWKVLRKKVNYRAEKIGHEIVQYPAYTLKLGHGDCEDFTILVGVILQANNIDFNVVLADYGKGWQHIYVEINGIRIDPTEDKFNQKDFPIKTKVFKL